MFFTTIICTHVDLKPNEVNFSENPRDKVVEKTYEFESTCINPVMYVLEVENVVSIGRGTYTEGACNTRFPVRFEAKVFEPVVGEIIKAKIVHVEDFGAGLFARHGPLDIFIPANFIPNFLIFHNNRFNSRLTDEVIGVDSEVYVMMEKYATCSNSNNGNSSGNTNSSNVRKPQQSMMWVGRLVL